MPKDSGNITIHYLEDKHKKTNSTDKLVYLFFATLFVYLFFVFVFPFGEGHMDYDTASVLSMVKTKFKNILEYLSGNYNTTGLYVLLFNTSAVVVGAGLAIAGATFQGEFGNALASPNILGVSSGAVAGNAFYLLFFTVKASEVAAQKFDNSEYKSADLSKILAQELCSFLGAIVAMAIVILFVNAIKKNITSNLTMLFCGMAVSALFSSVISIVEYMFFMSDPSDERLQELMALSMGTFNRVYSWIHLLILTVVVLICSVLLVMTSNKMDVLQFDGEMATTVGVNVPFYKVFLSILGSIIVAATVAFCGQIGLVGFLCPVIARKMYGGNAKKVYISSMLLGSIFLMVVYNLSSALQLSGCMGVVSSAIGTIVLFIYLFKGGRNNG